MSEPFAATASAVLAKIKSQKCSVVSEEGLSYEILCGGKTFFIPKPPDGVGYSQKVLDEIEMHLAAYGLELLPLDAYLH